MSKDKYQWVYGENDCQNYHEVKLGNDYLCVFANKKHPSIWMGFYIKNGSDITLMDKTFNDRQREKEEKQKIRCGSTGMPSTTMVLSNKNPEHMKRKVIYAYKRNLREVSR